MCTFVYLFLRDHLGEELGTHLKGVVWNRVVQLQGIAEEIAKHREKEWKAKIAKYKNMTPTQLNPLGSR